MRNKKILFILIPVIVVVLALVAGVVFLKLNSSPEKIFKTAINGVFNAFETSEEQLSTMKGTVKLTGSVETDNEQIQAINTILDGTSINLDMQTDTANMIINENLNVTVNNESLLNAAIILQDQKGYIYLKDYLDKYLEVPQENMEYSDLTEYYDKLATLNQETLTEAIKEELIQAVLNQELIQEDKILYLDGKETKVTASSLNLQGLATRIFANDFLTHLKENEKFQTALGEFKTDVITLIDNMLLNQDSTSAEANFIFTIYTKRILNEFVGISISTEIEGVRVIFSGDATQEDDNLKGDFIISVQEETIGKVNLNCAYNFTYGVQVQKVNTRECSIN